MLHKALSSSPDIQFIPHFLDIEKAHLCLLKLLEDVPWKQEKIRMFGEWKDMPRLTAWMGEKEAVYQYSGLVNNPLPWHPEVLALRDLVSKETGSTYNSVLLNYYRDGKDSMGWHSDDEKELGKTPVIASLSLGATRRMRFRPKGGGKNLAIDLSGGSLLVMKGLTQAEWQHALPKTVASGLRINLTFRLILNPIPQH